MKQNNIVNDTVYGHIPYSKFEEKFLKSKIVNRLLFVSQNALAYFAFPSISTKRYIHSLGTMHVSSHMFKNSLINSSDKTRRDFLKNSKLEIKSILKNNNLNINLSTLDIYDKTLLGFSFSLDKKYEVTYLILLQALRLAGLLHDVGHLPFSHQTEYALKRLYMSVKKVKTPNKEEKSFLKFYENITDNSKLVLHESVGYSYLEMLFKHELLESNENNKDVVELYYIIVKNILNNIENDNFSYKTLHDYVASPVDADRIDYINRDLLASGYISTSADFLRVTRESILIKEDNKFKLSFMTSSLADIEHLLESRFNLYKKVFFTHNISRLDTLLEKIITHLAKEYLSVSPKDKKIYQSIAMMWKFSNEKDKVKQLDIISQLDENWLISLFKKEYFKIKYQLSLTYQERYYLTAFEDILFGKKLFKAKWKNLSEFYKLLELSEEERYIFREKFGKVSERKEKRLAKLLNNFLERNNKDNDFFAYSIVSLSIGIDKNFLLYDGEKSIKIDEVSTLRKRLITSRSNTVPFYIFTNKKSLTEAMKKELKEILFKVFL
ncbi:MAG: Deoxyguanosinetriphosphate triphosphohydrolase (EC [uncultured Sulfurovum sp.]|uniref:Deoxyguanosinetriphosphate triphosphohydrolase (EC) n=1 Tax=uncultured Sulfurovum sp. TaxID=269237 RepID=A0A6S6S8X9_9BACT|nr:MAG: Deoxyguanosinetriphosphate triphosphohydrolase (EC [uncultured Sulfurovum sp.]